jgi:hypothetical protein
MKSAQKYSTKSFTTGPVAGLLMGSLVFAGSGLTALGASVFTVDSSQSAVSISGNVMGAPIEEQGPGSLTAQYEGTLLVEVGDDAIQFPGQSHVVALDSGTWEPLPGGNAGSAPANYGGYARHFLTEGVAAARDVQVDFTSGTLALVDGKFDTQGITVTIPGSAPAALSYRVNGGINTSGAYPLAGKEASGQMAEASLVTVGSQQVLTIPIDYSFLFSLASPNDTIVTLTGQLVATRSL